MSKYLVYAESFEDDNFGSGVYRGAFDTYGEAHDEMVFAYENLLSCMNADEYDVDTYFTDTTMSAAIDSDSTWVGSALVRIIELTDKPYVLMHVEISDGECWDGPQIVGSYDSLEDARAEMATLYDKYLQEEHYHHGDNEKYYHLYTYSAVCGMETMEYQHNLDILCKDNEYGFALDELVFA